MRRVAPSVVAREQMQVLFYRYETAGVASEQLAARKPAIAASGLRAHQRPRAALERERVALREPKSRTQTQG
jgi:hypothetical protein